MRVAPVGRSMHTNYLQSWYRFCFGVTVRIGSFDVLFKLAAEFSNTILQWPGSSVSQSADRGAWNDADVVGEDTGLDLTTEDIGGSPVSVDIKVNVGNIAARLIDRILTSEGSPNA